MRLYDTLTGKVRELELREPNRVAMYVCGPTVYDHPHLGHARSAITYDVLRRYLEWSGLTVDHVANITDIDDKIIAQAQADGSSEAEVAAKWSVVYGDMMKALNVLPPDRQPKATDWVDEMVDLVGKIIAANAAYETSSGVYLRVEQVPGYGDLVRRSLSELRESAGARVALDEEKEDPLDFALWKAAKPHEPSWESPWGRGRPGWHIECAAMSLGILGDGFDIHGGGSDLIFPHHTNERAEALAAGYTFARHWMHNAMLNVDGQKMAKSLDNYRTVQDMLDEHPLNARAFRLLVLQTHYRKTMEVNPEILASARGAIERLDALARRAADGLLKIRSGLFDGDRVKHFEKSFRDAMENDLGTPRAVSVMFNALRDAHVAFDRGSPTGSPLTTCALEMAQALGLDEELGGSTSELGDEITLLLERREAAREAKDWAAADAWRDELTTLGIIVEDTSTGPIARRALTA